MNITSMMSHVPSQLKDVFGNFYNSMQEDMKKNDAAVKAAAQDQDNSNSDSSSTQQTS